MRLFKKYLLLPIVLLTFVLNAKAQLEFPEDKVSWKFTVEQNGCDATIIGTITCVEHWHVYAANLPAESFLIATTVEPDKSPNYKIIGKVLEPKPEFFHDEAADEDIWQHSHTFKLRRKIKISSKEDFTLKGMFGFQTCDETHCLPPFDVEFSVKIKGCGEETSEGDEKIEDTFASINGDEAKGKDGSDYVQVNDKWTKVPEGNSSTFYKKYLALGGSHNE